MGLYLQIGAYTTATCTVRVANRAIAPVKYNGFTVAHQHTITFDGHLYADGPGNLSTAMNLMEAAIKVPNSAIGIVSTVTGNTSHFLTTTGAIGLVQVDDFKFVDTPLHMATEVKFSLTASAMYNNAFETRNIVSLEETVSVTGEGGPEIVLAPQVGAISIYQQVSDFTDVQVVQSGRVTGRTLPSLPSPVIPGSEARMQKLTRDTISYQMRGTSILLRIREYQYTFQLPVHPGLVLPTVLT